MSEIQPFRGVLYNTQRVKPADVLTQPYDKITPEMRERYMKLSPCNLVRIELGKEQAGDTEMNNKYTRARDLHRAWLRDGVLRRSAQPALYYLEQTFAAPGGLGTTADGAPALQQRTRKALIARVRLHRWDEGYILPHEHTLSKPKVDRLALLRACGSQQGQIFMLYPKPKVSLSDLLAGAARRAARPDIELADDYDVTNRLWEITDPAVIRTVQETLRGQKFYIADGHHRYETALAFRDECCAAAAKPDPNASYEFVMATLVDISDPGLVILPTHRAVGNLGVFDRNKFWKSLAKEFVIETQPSLEKLFEAMSVERASSRFPSSRGNEGTGETTILLGMVDREEFALLRPKNMEALRPLFANKPPLWDRLDVALLHVAILESLLGIDQSRLLEESNVTYWREPEKALEQVRNGPAQLAFFLNPTRVEEVRAIADARSRMPQKSTDFYPKLLSGLVINEVGPGHIEMR